MRIKLLTFLSIALLIGATGCNSNKQPQEQPKAATKHKSAKPAEFSYETGRAAFQRLYAAARLWAADAQPIRIQSEARPENKEDGKSDVWGVSFASASRHGLRPFIWSGATGQSGITPGNEDVYSATNVSTRTFDPAFLKIDSDKALEVARKKGGKDVPKEGSVPVKFDCMWDVPKARLVWRVIFGKSDQDAKVFWINASTGDFIKAEK